MHYHAYFRWLFWNQTSFDRLDYQPSGSNIFHLNLFSARNWVQIPNAYDQLSQDRRQRVLTGSIARSYQQTFGPRALLTINPYVARTGFSTTAVVTRSMTPPRPRAGRGNC